MMLASFAEQAYFWLHKQLLGPLIALAKVMEDPIAEYE